MERLFLHVDMNNFYASVECASRPDLDGCPVAVAGSPERRHGVVLAKNQIAKKYGVKTGDTVWEAQTKAPGIVFLPPHFDKYDVISKKLFSICEDYTCYVEPFGPDECWLDCTETAHLFGTGEKIADSIRARVKKDLGITASVGVSFTKMFAKLGSDMKKPDGTTVIGQDNFKEKVWPLSADELCGVGRSTIDKLRHLNIYTIGDLALADERVLRTSLGKPGVDVHKVALGEACGEVRESVVNRDVKSIGHGLTATRDLKTWDDIVTLVHYLSELVSARLVRHGYKASGIGVYIKRTDLSGCGKQASLPYPVCSSNDVGDNALALIKELHGGEPLRAISISTFALSDRHAPLQLSFFGNSRRSATYEKLDEAITNIKNKYGANALTRACNIGQNIFMDKTVGDFLPFKR